MRLTRHRLGQQIERHPAGLHHLVWVRNDCQIFAGLGVTRMLVTRLDAARRLGGVLSAAAAGNFSFSDVGVTPHIVQGLNPLNPVALARIILGNAAGALDPPHDPPMAIRQ